MYCRPTRTKAKAAPSLVGWHGTLVSATRGRRGWLKRATGEGNGDSDTRGNDILYRQVERGMWTASKHTDNYSNISFVNLIFCPYSFCNNPLFGKGLHCSILGIEVL